LPANCPLTPADTQAIVTLAVLAAFADGDKHDRERDELKRIVQGLGRAHGVHLPTLYQDVLMKRVDTAAAVAGLSSSDARQLAYEMAVCVCDADGMQLEAEMHFLASLRSHLGLGVPAERFAAQAEEIAAAPIGAPAALPTPGTAAPAVDNAALDQVILNAAILNGALELLPETLSTMAIIPLQMKLVYRIGQARRWPRWTKAAP
jgi:tellurite resistance protein